MQGLILAAGMGSRIRELGPSKPLVMLNGKPLIEHCMERLAAAGVERFVVVTGYERHNLEPELDRIAAVHGWVVAVAYNPDWQKPNGLSVLSARSLLSPRFVLTMADHIVDPALTRRVIEAAVTDGRPALGIDFDLNNPLVDMDDVTRVKVEANVITAIGKNIADYNGFDTGIFVGTSDLINSLDEAAQTQAPSLSDGVRLLPIPMHAVDVTGKFWIDVDEPRAFSQAQALIA